MYFTTRILFCVTLAMTSIALGGENPAELGEVQWERNLEAALERSTQTERPVLLLFQEVPGCHGCQVFGQQPLSHPLLVEAMETLFIPVAIHNNKPGYDSRILKRYEEPAWNYPVMRFIDSEGKDILPRKDKIYSIHNVAERMIAALEAAEREVPEYLRLIAVANAPTTTATFSMYCYWEGEGQLGALPGVTNTRAGWVDGKEVVEVTYDPNNLTYDKLHETARAVKCADTPVAEDRAKTIRDAKDSDQRYYLSQSACQYLPLTPIQATRINAAIRHRRAPEVYLSRRQIELLTGIHTALRDAGGDDHDPAARAVLEKLRALPASDTLDTYDNRMTELTTLLADR